MNKLDTLALSYLDGDKTALEKMCKIIIPIIVGKSEEMWYKVKNNLEFECRCLKKLERSLQKFDPQKGKFSSLVFSIIESERRYFLKARKAKKCYHFDDLAVVDKDGNISEYPIVDEKTSNIEEDWVGKESLNEKITLLAQGDPKRKLILLKWVDGYTNDSEIADVLAHKYNGNSESFRKFIHRFRNECKEALLKQSSL